MRIGMINRRNLATLGVIVVVVTASFIRFQLTKLAVVVSNAPLLPVDGDCAISCPKMQVNASCPRYGFFPVEILGGIGHRVTEVLWAWKVCSDYNLAFAVDGTKVLTGSGNHMGYWWAEEYFGDVLKQFPTVDDVLRGGKITLHDICPFSRAQNTTECNVIYRFNDICCNPPETNCFLSNDTAGAFDSAKDCFRCHVRKATLLRERFFNVVWHLRIGDIWLHAQDPAFFTRVWNAINESFPAPKMRRYVRNIFTYESPVNVTVPPPDFEFLGPPQRILPNVTFVPTQSSFESMSIFMHADILVSTGSSFASVAGLLSDRMLFFQHDPKHGGVTEMLKDAVRVVSDGTLALPGEAIRSLLQSRLCSQHYRSVPVEWDLECNP